MSRIRIALMLCILVTTICLEKFIWSRLSSFLANYVCLHFIRSLLNYRRFEYFKESERVFVFEKHYQEFVPIADKRHLNMIASVRSRIKIKRWSRHTMRLISTKLFRGSIIYSLKSNRITRHDHSTVLLTRVGWFDRWFYFYRSAVGLL